MTTRPTFRPSLAVLSLVFAWMLGGCSGTDDNVVAPGPDCDGFNLLVFASDRDNAPGETDIYVYDLDLNQFRGVPGLNTGAAEKHPSIAYDRRTMAFVGSGGAGNGDIILYNRCTAIRSTLPEIASPANESDPAFSGDGTLLAFVRDTTTGARLRMFEGQTLRLVPMPALDSLAAVLGPYDDRRPAPNGNAGLIAFTSNRSGNQDIWIYDRAGDSLIDIPQLRSSGDEDDPWWTPDGVFLAFASNRPGGAGGWDIYILDLRSRTFVNVPGLNSASNERDPALWKNGTLLFFESDRPGGKGRMDLYTYNTQTHAIVPLTVASSPGDDIEPGVISP